MNIRLILLVVFISTASFGCANVPLAPYQPSVQNLELLRNPQVSSLKVGEFALAPGKNPSMDISVSARGHTVVSPNANSFSQYLREALVADLRTAGKHDPNSSIVVRGWLTNNQLDASGVSVNSASLGAKFFISRGDRVLFEKEIQEQSQWESSFMGGIAIPAAINEYTALYQKLLRRLYSDDSFRKATRYGM